MFVKLRGEGEGEGGESEEDAGGRDDADWDSFGCCFMKLSLVDPPHSADKSIASKGLSSVVRLTVRLSVIVPVRFRKVGQLKRKVGTYKMDRISFLFSFLQEDSAGPVTL